MARQSVHFMIIGPPKNTEKRVGLFVQMDRIVGHPCLFEQGDQLGPYLVMAFLVGVFAARIEMHFECEFFHQADLHMDQSLGSAMTDIKSAPITIDITIPGTFSKPSPKVTSPITNAAITTPGIEPEPPRILTPPSTTMVTI